MKLAIMQPYIFPYLGYFQLINSVDTFVILDDVNYILNKDQAASNVAQSTKQDMLNQMKNVRNMPGSASGVNSQGNSNDNPDRDVFNSILGFDSATDNLFG